MTTIACDLKHMVGDRRVTCGDIYFPSTKIFRVRGDIVGAAGLSGECEAFIDWYRKQSGEIPALDKDAFEALVLTKSGIYFYDYTCVGSKIERTFHAIGCGALGALVAMAKGAAPKEAIELVAQFSNSTGPETDTIEL
jgi:20S proteasome alpha/beta subunit